MFTNSISKLINQLIGKKVSKDFFIMNRKMFRNFLILLFYVKDNVKFDSPTSLFVRRKVYLLAKIFW